MVARLSTGRLDMDRMGAVGRYVGEEVMRAGLDTGSAYLGIAHSRSHLVAHRIFPSGCLPRFPQRRRIMRIT
jgi:hypothetical protein